MSGRVAVRVRTQRPHPYRVELVGLPGAGKTRLGRSVAAGLTARGVIVDGPDRSMDPTVGGGLRVGRKALASAGVALRAPGLTLRVAGAVVRSRQPGIGDVAARLVQWQVAQHLLRRRGPAGSVRIVDEGLLQCLWSVGLRGDVDPVLGRLGQPGPWESADLLVVVRTPPEVALARLRRRASRHSRTQHLAEEAQRAELERGARLLDELVAWWARSVGPLARVVEVDGSRATAGEHDELARHIADVSRDG